MNELNGSCLIDACNDGDLEAVRRLLDEGRNVNEITEEGESLLSLACSSGYYELAQLLLATHANVEDRGLKDTTPLMEAASAGHVGIVKLLLSHGANVNAQTSQGNTPLMYACAGGHVEVVKLLIKHGANVEDHNVNGHTPLMEAASAGHVAVAKILVKNGASINSHSDEFKESALTLACYKGHLEMVRFLLSAGADQEHKTEEMHTALMEASMDGHVEVARLLLDSGAQVNMPADSFESPLTLASCGGHVELAMLLLERGANIEEVNDEGYTPLMEAAREGQEEMVALLLSQGADINAQTEETQETALTLACCSNSLEVAEFLIKAGADIEAGANTPLMEASQEGHIELVRHLIAAGANVNPTTASGETALMYACENGHTNVAEILLDSGADLEHEAEGGRTPLMKAARAGHLCTVQFLVSRGANINKVTSNNDHTPLSLACAGGHLNVVEYLLSQGADPTHRLKDNSTMLIEAARGGHIKVVQLLIDYPNRASRSPLPPDITSNHQCSTTNGIIPNESCDTPGRIVHRGSISHDPSNTDHLTSSSQRKSSIPSSSTGGSLVGKLAIQKATRNKNLFPNIINKTKACDAVEPYVPHPAKGRSTLSSISTTSNGKHLERSLSDSSASQILNSIASFRNSDALSASCSSSGAPTNRDDISQRVGEMKLCMSDKIASSREQKILHKQKILEELVRVEKELQESRQERLSLHQKAQQQQQLIQTLCYESDLSSSTSNCQASDSPSSPPSSLTSTTPLEGESNNRQQVGDHQNHLPAQQLNNLPGDISTQAMLLLDMSALKKQLKTGDSLNFQIPTNLAPSGNNVSNSQQIIFQNMINANELNVEQATSASNGSPDSISEKESASASVPTTLSSSSNISPLVASFSPLASSPSTIVVTSSSSPLVTNLGSRSRVRNGSKLKSASTKPHHPPFISEGKLTPSLGASSMAEDEDEANQTNCSPSETVPSQDTSRSPQSSEITFTAPCSSVLTLCPPQPIDSNQTVYVQRQQALLEFAQNIGYRPDAFQIFQQSNYNTNYPLFFPPWVDLNSLDNLPHLQRFVETGEEPLSTSDEDHQVLQPQQTQATQTLISSLHNMLNNNLRKLANSASEQQANSFTQQSLARQTSQSTQTPSPPGLNGETVACTSVASFTNKSDQSFNTCEGDISPQKSEASTKDENSEKFTTAIQLTSQNLQALKNHLSTVALPQQPSGDLPDDNNRRSISPSSNLLFTDTTSSSSSTSCTKGKNSVPKSDVFTLGAPTFPINLNLTPMPTPASSSTVDSDSSIFPQHITLETGEKPSPFILATKKLNDGFAGDFSNVISSPSISSSCYESNESNLTTANSRTLFPSNVSSVIEPFNFSKLSAPTGLASTPLAPPLIADNNPNNVTTNITLPVISSVPLPQVTSINQPSSTVEHLVESQTQTISLETCGETVLTTSNVLTSTGVGSENLVHLPSTLGEKVDSASSPPPWYPPIDLDSHTDSNHDTALTLACAGGHEELVELLISRGANIEHRDKKGFTPLMLAASGGKVGVCEILLNHNADIEAQSERTKDTALSLACSSGRYEVVELLLQKGANKEHRNVSDYTPLSLAASGGYVNIIKLLLSHGAEINSRTGSKLGISPLMLAAMNGHTATVKLLLDMGSDINAQIETNRNTALTLACFQGRCEVVSLLLDRKANVEHRAKTGLTPLMEAASGGYVDVGRVLLDKGADVNAPPVPSSRDTALTIAADKGHYRFVELLLQRNAQVDVKNKKGSSPLWLACNGGHLDVVQLLVNAKTDIDSQDNRKVSCLMAAFRKGHVKVVKWMVKHVTQFPSDPEMTRFMAMITDKELLKKCHQCMEHIRAAKEKQAAEANKNATILLEEIDMERYREETKKQAAARRREKKRQKKKEKQEKEKALKEAQDSKDNQTSYEKKASNKIDAQESSDSEGEDAPEDSGEEELVEEERVPGKKSQPSNSPSKEIKKLSSGTIPSNAKHDATNLTNVKKKIAEKNKKNQAQKENVAINTEKAERKDKDKEKKRDEIGKEKKQGHSTTEPSSKRPKAKSEVNSCTTENLVREQSSNSTTNKATLKNEESRKFHDKSCPNSSESSKRSSQDHSTSSEAFIDIPKINSTDRAPSAQRNSDLTVSKSTPSSNSSSIPIIGPALTASHGAAKSHKREEGWKEVVRRSKKVSVPANAISRVIGRGGCNINAVREISGANIEVEKQKGQGDRQIIIKGSADATRHAQQLINCLVNEPEKDFSQIVAQLGLTRTVNSNDEDSFCKGGPVRSFSTANITCSSSRTSVSSVFATTGVSKSSSVSAVFTPASNIVSTSSPPFPPKATGLVPIRPAAALSNSSSPFGNANTSPSIPSILGGVSSSPSLAQITGTNVWSSPKPNVSTSRIHTSSSLHMSSSSTAAICTNTTFSYTTAVSAKTKTVVKPTSQMNNISHAKFITGDSKPSGPPAFASTPVRPHTQPFNSASRTPQHLSSQPQQPAMPSKGAEQFKQPAFNNSASSTPSIVASPPCSVASSVTTSKTTSPGSSATPEYTPFNNLFSKVAQPSVWVQSKETLKPNFASVAAAGISSVASSQQTTATMNSMTVTTPSNPEIDVNVDASKAPGYRGNLHVSMATTSLSTTMCPSNSNFGPIGSGPRSAPCTPPLTSMSMVVGSSANRAQAQAPNTAPTTPPPMRSSAKESPSNSSPYSITDPPTSVNSSANILLSNNNSLSNNSDSSNVSNKFSPSLDPNVLSTSLSTHKTQQPEFNLASSMSNASRAFVSSANYSSLSNMESIHSVMPSSDNQLSAGQTLTHGIPNVAVQSSLNPNAPDFAVRSNASYLPNQLHQPNVGNQAFRTVQSQQNLPRSMAYQDMMPNVQGIQMLNSQQQHTYRMGNQGIQMQNPPPDINPLAKKNTEAPRNPYLSFISLFNQTANFQTLATLQSINQIPAKVIPPPYPSQPPQPPQPPIAAFQIPNQSYKMHSTVQAPHPSPQLVSRSAVYQGHCPNPVAPMSSVDYNPQSADAIRLLQTAINAANTNLQTNPNMSQYGILQSNLSQSQFHTMQNAAVLNMRHTANANANHQPQSQPQPQQQCQQSQRLNPIDLNQASATPIITNTNISAKDELTAEMAEEKRRPRPIGTERAQKKNPIYGGPSSSSTSIPPLDNLPSNANQLWPFNPKVSSENADWLLSGNRPSTAFSTSNATDILPTSSSANNYQMLNRNYMPMSEAAPHEPDYNVNYHYFSSNM